MSDLSLDEYDRLCMERFAWIPWLTPVAVLGHDGVTRFACRLCIGRHGLRGDQVDGLWTTAAEVTEHLLAFHDLE